MSQAFPSGYQNLDHDTHLIDIGLYRPELGACYLLRDGDELAFVDCGTARSLPQILATIETLGCRPEQVRWVIPTHVHLDHGGGAGQLMAACPNATLVAHPNGYPHLVDPSRLQAGATAVYGEEEFARDYGELLAVPAERAIAAEEGQQFELGGRKLSFIHTPGHANHHGCVFDSQSGYLFTGDTFGLGYQEFAASSPYIVATTSPVAFDPEAWQDSLDRMLAYQPDAVCLTHYSKHVGPASLAPMLRESIEAHVRIALEEEENGSNGRDKRLQDAVDDLLVGGAVAHCGMDAERAREILWNDIRLNAQGLGVWLKRRAKRREQA